MWSLNFYFCLSHIALAYRILRYLVDYVLIIEVKGQTSRLRNLVHVLRVPNDLFLPVGVDERIVLEGMQIPFTATGALVLHALAMSNGPHHLAVVT